MGNQGYLESPAQAWEMTASIEILQYTPFFCIRLSEIVLSSCWTVLNWTCQQYLLRPSNLLSRQSLASVNALGQTAQCLIHIFRED